MLIFITCKYTYKLSEIADQDAKNEIYLTVLAYISINQLIKFINMDVVRNIIEIRKEKRINQENIADALNVDATVISKIENGTRQLKVDELAKIAEILNEDVIYLFTYPKRYVDRSTLETNERISVTFEISPDKRDYLLKLVTQNEKNNK